MSDALEIAKEVQKGRYKDWVSKRKATLAAEVIRLSEELAEAQAIARTWYDPYREGLTQ